MFGDNNGLPGVIGAPPTTTNPMADTVVAVMYNYYDSSLLSENSCFIKTNNANRIVLNPYYDSSNIDNSANIVDASNNTMLLSSFLNLFYATNSGYFNVNPTNVAHPAICLPSQSYTSTNSGYNRFSLTQELLKAYCTNKGVNVNDIDSRTIILLQKETFASQSLAVIKGSTVAMSWDEVISSLVRSQIIEPSGNNLILDPSGNIENAVVVPLSIILNYHSFVLDTDLSIRFTYLVNMRGYVLTNFDTQTYGWGFGPAQPTINSVTIPVPWPSVGTSSEPAAPTASS